MVPAPRLWYRIPVPCLIRAATTSQRVARILRPSGLELLHLHTWSAVAALPEEASVLLFDLPGRRPQEELPRVVRCRLTRPDLSLLLVDTALDSTTLRLLPGGVELIRVGIDEPRLVQRVMSARFASWRERCLTRVTSSGLPLVLRSALRALLRQAPASPSLEPHEMPLHTIGGLAGAIPASREHLSRLASKHDVPLRRLADTWLAVRALALYELERVPWKEVAWRCGYRSTTGLDDLVSRCLDLQSSKMEEGEWIGALEKFESDLDHVLRR